MPSYTIGATLSAVAAPTFPLVLPFNFGPQANAVRNAPVYSPPTMVTVTTSATMTRNAGVNASLAIGSQIGLPYTLPFILNAGPGGAPYAGMNEAGEMNAPQTVTVTLTASVPGGNHYFADISLAVTANRTETLSWHTTIGGSETITASLTGFCSRNQKISASTTVTAALSAAAKVHATANASLAEALSLTVTGGHGQSFAALRSITATTNVYAGTPHLVNASLVVTISHPFPYTFPFIFDQSPDSLSQKQPFIANLTPVVALSALVARKRFVAATQTVTASPTAILLQGFERTCDVSRTITVGTSATMTRHRYVDSSQVAFINTLNKLTFRALIRPSLLVTTSTFVVTRWTAHAAVAAPFLVQSSPQTSLQAQVNAALVAGAVNNTNLTKMRLIDASVGVNATGLVNASLETLLDGHLSVLASPHATYPEVTGFYPFYLR